MQHRLRAVIGKLTAFSYFRTLWHLCQHLFQTILSLLRFKLLIETGQCLFHLLVESKSLSSSTKISCFTGITEESANARSFKITIWSTVTLRDELIRIRAWLREHLAINPFFLLDSSLVHKIETAPTVSLSNSVFRILIWLTFGFPQNYFIIPYVLI